MGMRERNNRAFREGVMVKLSRRALGGAAAVLLFAAMPAQAADPIKVGMSLALTGTGAPAGKMLQAAIELWRDDINAKGGLIGRPVEVIVYDDQRSEEHTSELQSRGLI